MSYQDTGMRVTLGSSYGTIGEDEYLRKIQATGMYEDPDMIENYFRSTLVDLKPDKPIFASDDVRIDNGSTERLNLRHSGARSSEDPYLPDGTFLDHEFMEADPRSQMLGPDMRKHVEQQYARASLIKMYNDNDLSVPETAIHPITMRDNIRSAIPRVKSMYKNFDESFDSWHNGGVNKAGRKYGSDLGKIKMSGVILDLSNSEQRNRADATTRLSNDPTMAFRGATTDHRVKVARYGMIRARQDPNEQDWDNNRKSTFLDHKLQEINGQMVNRMLANMIIDIQGQRNTKMSVAQGASYNDSTTNMIRQHKIHPDDIYKILRIAGGSQPASAHEAFDGLHIAKKPGRKTHDNYKLRKDTQINHEILNSMQQANKVIKDRNKDNVRALRDEVQHTSKILGIHAEGFNKRIIDRSKVKDLNREVLDTRVIEEQLTVKTYAGVKPCINRNPHQDLEWERYAKESKNTINRLGRRQGHQLKTTDDYEQEQDQGEFEFGTYDKASPLDMDDTKGRSIQYETDYGDTILDDNNEIGDQDL